MSARGPLELRGGVRAAPVAGATVEERQALRFAPDPRERDADPDHVVRVARENDQDGLDSALVTQFSSWPDPTPIAAWALAATSRLRIALAHRVGTVAPTIAARSLLTLDRLSRGRVEIHVIMGSSDADVLRDGDPLGKAERYERAGEFLEVFTRALSSERPFDWSGDHYTVRDAWSGLQPFQRPHPPISLGGASPPGIALAARFADVYGIAPLPLEQSAELIARVQTAAAEHGRALRIWRHARFLLAPTDADAAAAAERIAATLAAHGHDADHHLASSFIGSPATAAAEALAFHRAGVDVLQLDTPVETPADRALRAELIGRLRAGAETGADQRASSR